jgi:hypothetical protein
LSTSTTEGADAISFGKNCALYLTVPPGKQAPILMSGISQHPDETEALFPPGTSYKIDRVEKKRGKVQIYATLL